ncbi:hypothetical protein CA13_73830 [Planctomycetes bacterium CA13]|uniref:Uncharacterized protein n=1 Tax=Novipirellula herctigrandis TaxID=2527986 RepID=A0A5C5YLP9_9BACT|nr:hypothetical protein CA13_73830 [Planctomycetes bacterium CA13]
MNPLTVSPKSMITENGSLLVGLAGPVIVGVGTFVSTTIENWVAAPLGLPAISAATLAATLTVTTLSVVASIVAVYFPLPLSTKLLAFPPPTVTSPITNPLTVSPKSIDTVNGSLLVGLAGPVIVGAGAVVSTATEN